MFKKVLIITLIVVAIVAVFVGGYFFWQKQNKEEQEKYTGPVEKITIGFPLIGAELNALIFVAEEKGYFREQGLEVSIKHEPSVNEGQKDLIDGGIDLASATDYTIAANVSSTQNIRIITAIDNGQYLGITARKDKGITNPSDLKGKRIGIMPKTISEFYLYQFLADKGISDNDVQIVGFTPDKIVPALLNDEIDAISAGLSLAYQANKSLGADTILWFLPVEKDSFWLLTAKKDWITMHPDLIKRFIKSLVASENFVKNNEQEAMVIVAKNINNPDKDYFDFVWSKHNFTVSLNQSLLLALEGETRWAIKNNLTDKTKVPNYLYYIYSDALETVKPEAVTIIH